MIKIAPKLVAKPPLETIHIIQVQEPIHEVLNIKSQIQDTLFHAADDLVKFLEGRKKDPIDPSITDPKIIFAMRLSEVEGFIDSTIIAPTTPAIFELVSRYNEITDPSKHYVPVPIDTWTLSKNILVKYKKNDSFRALLETPFKGILELDIPDTTAYTITVNTSSTVQKRLVIPVTDMPDEFCSGFSGKVMTAPSQLKCSKDAECKDTKGVPYTANHDETPPFCPCGAALDRTDRPDIREKMHQWLLTLLENAPATSTKRTKVGPST